MANFSSEFAEKRLSTSFVVRCYVNWLRNVVISSALLSSIESSRSLRRKNYFSIAPADEAISALLVFI